MLRDIYIYIHKYISIPGTSWNLFVLSFFAKRPPRSKVEIPIKVSGSAGDSGIRSIRRNFVDHPIGSMYGIFTYINHRLRPNVGKYTIHGFYGHYKKTTNMTDEVG